MDGVLVDWKNSGETSNSRGNRRFTGRFNIFPELVLSRHERICLEVLGRHS